MSEPAQALLLVVEDDDDIREAVCTVLEDEGYALLRAGNGREALDLLRRERPPRLILLDQRMPVMDGAAFLEARGREPGLASIPVVMLSADTAHTRRGAPPGVAMVLEKPVSIEALVRVARRFCGPEAV